VISGALCTWHATPRHVTQRATNTEQHALVAISYLCGLFLIPSLHHSCVTAVSMFLTPSRIQQHLFLAPISSPPFPSFLFVSLPSIIHPHASYLRNLLTNPKIDQSTRTTPQKSARSLLILTPFSRGDATSPASFLMCVAIATNKLFE